MSGVTPGLANLVSISVSDIKNFEVDSLCGSSYPCGHDSTLTLNDGRKARVTDGLLIAAIIADLPLEKITSTAQTMIINMGKKDERTVTRPGSTPESLKKHFATYKNDGLRLPNPDELLTKHFSKSTQKKINQIFISPLR